MKVSYTVTPFLKSELHTIEEIRNKNLLYLTPPSVERKLAWETKIYRTYFMLTSSDKKVRKSRLDQIFRETTPKKNIPEVEELAYRYKQAQDYIEQNWTLERGHVSENDIKRIHHTLTSGPAQKVRDIKAALEFIQSTPEHPIIQAALAYEMLLPLFEDKELAGRIATCASYIFLYKGGYDMKRQLIIEEYLTRDQEAHTQAAEAAFDTGNLSPFLDQFVNAIRTQAEAAFQKRMEESDNSASIRALYKLNDRQKQILTLLEEPGGRLSNKNVQKLYDISQVTASRDMAKLVHLGLIRPHGKGRSVYYTISNS